MRHKQKKRGNRSVSVRKRERSRERFHSIRGHLPRMLFYLVVMMFVALAIYVVGYSSVLRVDTIMSTGATTIGDDQIVRHLQGQIRGENFLRVSDENYMRISGKDLAESLVSQFPQIKNAYVTKVFPQSISVTIEEHDIIVVLCGVGDHEDLSRCVIVNQELRIQNVSEAHPDLLVHNEFVIVRTEEAREVFDAGAVMSQEVYERILFLVQELPFTLGVRVNGDLQLSSLGSTHLSFTTDEGWVLRVDLAHDPRLLVQILEAFFSQTQQESVRQNITEIDIRTLDKVFYRLRESDIVFAEDTLEQ